MLWTIGIVTQARRREKLHRLLSVLLPQAERYLPQVEVVGLWNNCGKRLHDYRQSVLNDAKGDYISFADDDDMVDLDFVQLVVEAMASKPGADFIAFGHAYYERGIYDRPTKTGLNIGPSRNERDVYIRKVTHINPVRIEIARKAGFTTSGDSKLAGNWEDFIYDRGVEELAQTEVVIDRVLYHYFHDFGDSVQSGTRPLYTVPRRPLVRSPAFRWHPGSLP